MELRQKHARLPDRIPVTVTNMLDLKYPESLLVKTGVTDDLKEWHNNRKTKVVERG